MSTYLDQLNKPQRTAVEYLDGPSLVIAGAGSGKTRVLTYKIVHLLNNGYEPFRILALTFTNKAAREMRQRIESLVGAPTASKLWMGTFHSIFSRILRQNADRIGFKRDFTIYDTADSKSLIKTIIKDMGLDDKIYKPNVVQSTISMAKNALMSPEAYMCNQELMDADRRARRPELAQIYKAYKSRCFLAGAMDFDDLLYYTNVLLRDNADVLAHYREFFRYILVDEYQDTNFAQHLIVSQLCSNANNLCVVGDDAQSIYSFRGANIKNIINLKNAYPNLAIFKLEQNYRSTQNIINAANSLIEKNKYQIPKKVFSENELGNRIEVVECYSDYEESFNVANRLSQRKIECGLSYDEFAILYRTNAQSRILEESLRKRNVPYRIYGGLSFYQRKEIKDAIAYFRLSVNPNDDEALRRIINTPARGIGETTINKLVRLAIDNQRSIWEVLHSLNDNPVFNSGTRKRLAAFVEMIEGFIQANAEGVNAETLAVRIIKQTQLLSILMTDHTPESISKQENLQELMNGVKEFVSMQMEHGLEEIGISDYLAQISLLTDQDEEQGDEPRVTLMTVHAAKGLEFSNVFIVGLEEDLFPSAMSCSSAAEIEEERRLLYVAITRAKKFCMMSYAASRFRNGQTVTCQPSRFIRDINPAYLRMSAGTGYDSSPMFNPIESYQQSYHSTPNRKPAQSSTSTTSSFSKPTIQSRSPQNVLRSGGSSKYLIHEASELSTGMKIEHERFGRGTIKEIDTSSANPRIVVQFSSLDTKTLLLKFAKFNIL